MRRQEVPAEESVETDTRISSIITRKTIILELSARRKDDAIAELVKRLLTAKRIKKSEYLPVARAVKARERKGSTGLGRGIAIPHARMPGFDRMVGALGRSTAGLDFKALDGEPVHAVFLFVVPAEPTDIAYGLLSRMAALCRHDNFAPFIAAANDVEAIHEVLVDSDDW
jgi:mannitol/fructose-specific phosphotransferase system IIA component (Ntr-type)